MQSKIALFNLYNMDSTFSTFGCAEYKNAELGLRSNSRSHNKTYIGETDFGKNSKW